MMKKFIVLLLVFCATSSLYGAALPLEVGFYLDKTEVTAGIGDSVVATVKVVDLDTAVDVNNGVSQANKIDTSASGTLTDYSLGSWTAGSTFDGTNTLQQTDMTLASQPPGPYAEETDTLYSFTVTIGTGTSNGESLTLTISDIEAILYSHSTADYTLYSNLTVNDGTINVIPEPMTICLLGLGGLLLRRKKK
jgi:hypothetical protein